MKAILASMLLTGACSALVGCESDLPPNRQAANPLQRGLSGRGTVFEPDRSNDPVIREQTRVGN